MSHTEGASVRILDLLHRVPERWDGHTIDWDEWTQAPFICGPTSLRACENCGCTNPGIMCSGWVEQSSYEGNPTIAEIFYRWWTRKGDHIIDPFSGGPTRGLIAEKMGRKYTGIDIRPEQIAANRQYGDHWEIGDATSWSPPPADAIFTCPPYLGLEHYSDNPHDLSNMGLEDFDTAIHAAIANTVAALRNHRYIGIVISDVRRKDGSYQRLPDLIRTALAASGCHIVNSLIVVDPVGKKYLTGWKLLGQSRKVQRTHQELIIAVKGDIRTAAQRLATPDMHHTPLLGKEPS